MKRVNIISILVLSMFITACSPATTNLGTHTLGASLEQKNIAEDQDIEEQPTLTAQDESPIQSVSPNDPLPTMPIITEEHQGYTY